MINNDSKFINITPYFYNYFQVEDSLGLPNFLVSLLQLYILIFVDIFNYTYEINKDVNIL